jgi:hypothetical protein
MIGGKLPEVGVVDVAVDTEEALHHVAHDGVKVTGKGGTIALREERRVVQLHGGRGQTVPCQIALSTLAQG